MELEVDNIITRTEADAVLDFAREHLKVERFDALRPATTASAPVATVPRGVELKSLKPFLDEYRTQPERRSGTARVTTLASFIELTDRFKDEHSAIFAIDDPRQPGLTTVFDYHTPTAPGQGIGPRFGVHRAVYSFPLSDEWKAWTGQGGPMEQQAFAEFLEDRINDVRDPAIAGERTKEVLERLGLMLCGPARLLELARGLSLNVGRKVRQALNSSTGEASIVFEEEHTDASGAPLKVPGGFVIAIPVFRGGEAYSIPVRLRYRHTGGKVVWILSLHLAEESFREAFRESCEKAASATGLPLYYGSDEGPAR